MTLVEVIVGEMLVVAVTLLSRRIQIAFSPRVTPSAISCFMPNAAL